MIRVPPSLAKNQDFIDRLSSGWLPQNIEPAVSPGISESTRMHREALSAEFAGLPIVVFAGEAMLRNDDVNFPFRPDSDFLWLTGCSAEGAILAMLPVPGGHDSILFVPQPVVAGQPGFLDNRNHSALWVGAEPTLDAWSTALGMEVLPLVEASSRLGTHIFAESVAVAGRVTSALSGIGAPSARLIQTLSELRLIKDAWEIRELRGAVAATVAGFDAVRSELRAAMEFGGERWLQGTFDRVARMRGNGPGYLSIVAAGSHGPVLHWSRCDGPVLSDQLVLLDAGVEMSSFYTADVTRTFPAGGTFTAQQRLVHDLVQKSHEAGLRAVGPGRAYSDFHFASMEVIAGGLHDWGLLPVSVDEALADAGQHHRRYLVCGVGHHLGLDLHDCSHSRPEAYHGAPLRAGMVITVEPGLYFHDNDLTVPPELRGIGVRIEDDVLVTESGSEVLSSALPIDAGSLESWVAGTQ